MVDHLMSQVGRHTGSVGRIPTALLLSTLLLVTLPVVGLSQWVRQPVFNGSFYNEVYFATTTLGFITSHSGTIYRTTDGGDSWQTVTLPDAGFSSNRDIAFPTAQTGYLSGEDGIWKTTNGGSSWLEVTPDSASGVGSSSCWFRSASVGVWGYGSCADTIVTLWRTTDGGSTWSVTRDTATTDVAVGGMTYAGGEFKVSGGSGKFWRSSDDGTTWSRSNTSSAGWQEDLIEQQGTLLIASANGTSCGSTGGGKILRSTNGGTSWTSTSFASVVMWGVSMYSASDGMAVGDRGAAFRTTDGGATWAAHSCGLDANDRLDDVFMVSSTNGFAVGDGVYRYRPNTFGPVPDTLDFGDVVVGTNSPYLNALVRSYGNAGTITARAFAGADVGSFSSSANLAMAVPVPPCQDAVTPIRFSPQRTGLQTARLDVTLAGGAGTVRIVLKGNGVRPRLAVDDELRFDTLLCETTTIDSIRVANQGNYELVIDDVTIANDLGFFTLLSPSLPIRIPPFSNRALIFQGRASGTGTMAARVYLRTNDPDYVDSLRVIHLRMQRSASRLDELPDTITIPPRPFAQSSESCIELTNSTGEAISVTGVTSLDNVPEITVSLRGDPRIASGSTRALCFSGGAEDSVARCERFVLKTSPCDHERTIVVCYQAVAPGINLPQSLRLAGDCGEELVDSVVIRNSGDFGARIDSIALLPDDGTFVAEPGALPRQLLQNDSLVITVRASSMTRRQVDRLLLVYHGEFHDSVLLSAAWTGPDLRFGVEEIPRVTICRGDTVTFIAGIENDGEVEGNIALRLADGSPGRLLPSADLRAPGDSLPHAVRIVDLPAGTHDLRLLLARGCGSVDSLTLPVEVKTPPLLFRDSIIDLGTLDPDGQPRQVDVMVLNLGRQRIADATVSWSPEVEDLRTPVGMVSIDGLDSLLLAPELRPVEPGAYEVLAILESDVPCGATDTLRIRWRVRSQSASVDWLAEPIDSRCDSVAVARLLLRAPFDRPATFESIATAGSPEIAIDRPALPLVIAPGDSLIVTVRVHRPEEGSTADVITVVIDGSTHAFPVTLLWARPESRWIDQAGTVVDRHRLRRVTGCVGDTIRLEVMNLGDLVDTVAISASDPALLEVLTRDLILEPGERATVAVLHGDLPVGEQSVDLILTSLTCDTRSDLSVRLQTIASPFPYAGPVGLGDRCADSMTMFRASFPLDSAFPFEPTLELVTVDGGGLWSVENATLMQDRTAIELDIRISPGAPDDAVLAVTFSEPCAQTYLVPLRSRRTDCRTGELRLALDSLVGAWGDTVLVPVLLTHSSGPAPESIPTTITWDPDFLEILALEPGRSTEWIVDASTILEDREGRLMTEFRRSTGEEGSPGQVVQIGMIRGVILRGPVPYTDLAFDTTGVVPGATITWQNGLVALSDFCDAEGRLLRVLGPPGIRSVLPNPTDRYVSVRYYVPSLASHTITLVNAVGQELLRREIGEVPPGERIEVLDLDLLSTGLYYLTVEAGRFRLTTEIIRR